MSHALSLDAEIQLANFLVSYGLLTSKQLRECDSASHEGGKRLLENILGFGFTSEDLILEAITTAYDLDSVDLSDSDLVSISATSILPIKFIQSNRIVPIRISDNSIDVAISEPLALNSLTSVKLISKKEVKAFVAPITKLSNFINSINNINVSDKKNKIDIVKEEVDKFESKSSEVVDFVDKLLKDAIKIGASDVHLEPYKKFARMRYRVDGVLADQHSEEKLLFSRYSAITTRIKIMSELDIAERRLPQDGAITMQLGDKEVDLRVSILPTTFGERVVMRILDRSSISLTIETLGFDKNDEKKIKKAIDAPQGMVLVTGPTGSGKSTTLYAALDRVNKEEINILTAEDPVEFGIDGVGQVHVKEDIGLTFSSALRSFLRQDPEIVMVGEIRDQETISIAIKAALTGHLVLSTLHTNDAVGTITRLINMGVEPYMITSALSCVVAQRLSRKTCEYCKEIDKDINEGQLITAGFPIDQVSRINLFHGVGCKKCNNTGYKGRKGIYEVLEVTDNIKQGVLNNLTTPELLKVAQEQDGFLTMQDQGRGMLLDGSITFEEYMRILAPQ
jgi:type IV pilus assembly protein PilB